MFKSIFLVVMVFCFTSCATVFSKRTYDLEITSHENTKAKVYDSIYNLPAKVNVTRSKNDLTVVLISDTVTTNYSLQPSINPKYLYGNLSFVHLAPVGYLVDLTTQKRFYYGKSVFLNVNDTITQIRTPIAASYSNIKNNISNYFTDKHQTNKGQINLTVSIPWVNNFNFKPIGENRKNDTKFFSLTAGIDYYHTENKFLNIHVSTLIGNEVPVPVGVDSEGETESFISNSIGLTENHTFNRFTVGYGVQISKNKWIFSNKDYDENVLDSKKPYSTYNLGIGLTANAYFRPVKNLYIGLVYNPNLYNLKPSSKFQYEHVLSLDFVWKFRIKR